MKKLVCIFLAIMVLFTIVFSGCDKITKNTDPNSIKSSIVTEKEWREACSFIGMRDRGYELINEIEYPVMKKLSAFISGSGVEDGENVKGTYTYDIKAIKYDTHTGVEIRLDATRTVGNTIQSERDTRQVWFDERDNDTHAFYVLINFMSRVVGDFEEFTYDQEKGAYCKIEDRYDYHDETILKFNGNRLVCYQCNWSNQSSNIGGNFYILFYNYK